jgi:hypothetical protein
MLYVDSLFETIPRTSQAKRYGTSWCHLITDGEIEELHLFAESIGLKREYFQKSIVPHYDLTPGRRIQAVKKGAIEKPTRELSPLRLAWMKRWNGGNPDWL